MRRFCLFVLILLPLSCDPMTRSGLIAPTENGSTSEIMFTFSQAMTGLEVGIATDDPVALKKNAVIMSTKARKLVQIGASLPDLADQFTHYASEIREQSANISSMTKAHQYEEISRTIEQVRHACISCHIQFRDDKRNQYDLYPSKAGIITGIVDINDANGVKRVDRSNVLVYLDNNQEEEHKGAWLPADRYKIVDETEFGIYIDTPYFTRTDQRGFYIISGVPDGTYGLNIQLAFGPPQRQEIRVTSASLYDFNFLIQEDRLLRHAAPTKN